MAKSMTTPERALRELCDAIQEQAEDRSGTSWPLGTRTTRVIAAQRKGEAVLTAAEASDA